MVFTQSYYSLVVLYHLASSLSANGDEQTAGVDARVRHGSTAAGSRRVPDTRHGARCYAEDGGKKIRMHCRMQGWFVKFFSVERINIVIEMAIRREEIRLHGQMQGWFATFFLR